MPELADIFGAKGGREVYDALGTMPPEKRKQVAKYLKDGPRKETTQGCLSKRLQSQERSDI